MPGLHWLHFFMWIFFFFILAACEGAIFVVGVSFNIAILINVKSQTKNIPLIVHLNIMQYVFRNCTNFSTIIRVVKNLRWSMIPSQSQDITRNSHIFITRNKGMKYYYHNLLNCRNNKEWKQKTSRHATNSKQKRKY